MLSIKMFCYKLFQSTILFLHLTDVNCQFTFSAISLQPPISSVGSTATATCNVTYTGSTATTLTWQIDSVAVQQYRIQNAQVPQLGAQPASGFDTSPSTTTSNVNTGDTFPMILGIRNVSLTINQSTVSLGCSAPGCNTQAPLQIGVCQPNTASGVIATVSSSSCGLGCTVQYSCESGYTGSDVTATCQANATFDASTTCTLSSSLSPGAIAGIVIGCIIAVAIIIFFLIPHCCAEICCCAFTHTLLDLGKKKPEPDITMPDLKKNTQPGGPNGEGDVP
uniref:VCRL1 variant H n=1 Tax=Ciona intestinalis TaxID=7719 RepID=I3NN96_CIOIN|nr:vCRL1 variant H [Ciona intestinalis]